MLSLALSTLCNYFALGLTRIDVVCARRREAWRDWVSVSSMAFAMLFRPLPWWPEGLVCRFLGAQCWKRRYGLNTRLQVTATSQIAVPTSDLLFASVNPNMYSLTCYTELV
jgi:hypothetical protein